MTGGLLTQADRDYAERPVRRLVLVVGPTGAGKTDHSVDLARDTKAPIVVLDRVQCHRELAVGSGRPDSSGIDRTFLADRTVVEGVISPEAAYTSLVRLLTGNDEPAVLEGGSISLLAELVRRPEWRTGADITVEYVRPGADHRDRVHERVSGMLREGRTMLDEVRDLWPDPRTHPVLAGIVGYREILAAADGDRGFRFTGAALDRLVDAVTTAHLSYAAVQVGWLDTVLDTLRDGR